MEFGAWLLLSSIQMGGIRATLGADCLPRRDQVIPVILKTVAALIIVFDFMLFPRVLCAQSFIERLFESGDTKQSASEKLAKLAWLALDSKDYDKATVLLRTAISLNEGDAGAEYDPWAFSTAQVCDYKHGRAQLKQMLSDRPLMSEYIRPNDELWKWAVAKFGAKVNDSVIEWDASGVIDPVFEAQHEVPVNGSPGRIKFRNLVTSRQNPNKRLAFERMWLWAVFELHNIESAQRFQHESAKAYNGVSDEETFVRSMFAIEFQAAQRTRRWYVEVFLPHAKKYQLGTDPKYWYCTCAWEPPDSAFDQYTDKQRYPWNPYSRYFRELRTAKTLEDALSRLRFAFSSTSWTSNRAE